MKPENVDVIGYHTLRDFLFSMAIDCLGKQQEVGKIYTYRDRHAFVYASGNNVLIHHTKRVVADGLYSFDLKTLEYVAVHQIQDTDKIHFAVVSVAEDSIMDIAFPPGIR